MSRVGGGLIDNRKVDVDLDVDMDMTLSNLQPDPTPTPLDWGGYQSPHSKFKNSQLMNSGKCLVSHRRRSSS
jgi:hypothetical protein